jgi:hypothetical protein
MAQLSHRAKKHTARLKAMARAKRMLSLKRQGKRLLSDRVLKLLAAAELPPQKRAYEMKLRELLGE